jgi:glutaredoxin-like protein NrdH
MAIRVYSTKICPNCRKVKEFLAAEGAPFEEVDLTSAEALTELRMQGVFTLVTPVVQIGSLFLTTTELFANDELRKERVREVLKGEGEV